MGLNLAATIAAMNRAARTLALPPAMKLFSRHCPDWRVKGQRPSNAAISLRRQGPKLVKLRNEGARGGWANACSRDTTFPERAGLGHCSRTARSAVEAGASPALDLIDFAKAKHRNTSATPGCFT